MTAPVVRVENLRKHYGAQQALRGLDFAVRPGEIFGLIGPDGAGKTSTFHILGGVMEASGGRVSVLGRPPREARDAIGYLTERFSLYPDLSVEENLRYLAGLRRLPASLWRERRDRVLRLMDLEPFAGRLAGQLSGGMKQKLALCGALLVKPRLLLLDEPTTGVDPVSRREFWDVLATLAGEGVTVVVATPYLDEAERCHRIALLHEGTIRRLGSPPQLIRELGPDVPGGGPPSLEAVFVAELRRHESELPSQPFPAAVAVATGAGPAVRARHLHRRFGSFEAVSDMSLEVLPGEILGLLGANGAGKTTTIKMLCGLLPPSSGEVSLAGESGDLRSPEVLSRVGYMSQRFTLYDDLTILQNLRFYAGIYGIAPRLRQERIDWVLASCGLQGREHLLTARLPGGWKQRVAFGAAVMHEPAILFLDEPTSGVDPLARRRLWQLIRDFAGRGTAVLITTHNLEEAEQCHRLCLMVAGRAVSEGSPAAIKAAEPGSLLEIAVAPERLLPACRLLRQDLEPWRVAIFADRLHVVIDDPDRDPPRLRARLEQAGMPPRSLQPIPRSLEDAFIGVVQRARRER
jgi:ABC-2 type transport system ATP-binding protein